MTMQYRRFNPPRRPEEYQGQVGPHAGLALPPEAMEAIAQAKMRREPNALVVRGEHVRTDPDGTETHYLDLAVTVEHIERHTNYRADERGRLRWVCPECAKVGGGHTKACNWER